MSYSPDAAELRGLFEERFRAEQPAHRPFQTHEVAALLPGAQSEPVTAGAVFCPAMVADAHVGEFMDLPWGYGCEESLRAAVAEFGGAAARALRRLADQGGGRILYASSRALVPFPYFEVEGVAVGLSLVAPATMRASWCFGIGAQDCEP